MYQRRIGFLAVLAVAAITAACGTTEAGSSTKGKTDTTKEQGSGPGQGHEGRKMGGKDHPNDHPNPNNHPNREGKRE